MKSTAPKEIEAPARRLSDRGIECVLERFRLPAHPRVTPPLGFFAGAAAAVLLPLGSGAASFLTATAASVLLWLDDRGYSPLDWIGRKEGRTVLVIPGSPADGKRPAHFFGIPLLCRSPEDGALSGSASWRRVLHVSGLLLCAALCLVSAARLLRLWAAPSMAIVGVGTVLLLAAASESLIRVRAEPVRNRASEWLEPLSRPASDGRRPFLLLYSGDPEEVKYFLARHRRDLLRGTGLFLEWPDGASGGPAVSVREGAILPLRVDPSLHARVRSAAGSCGIPRVRDRILRYKSPGMFAMARGFRAATLSGGKTMPEGEAIGWAREILERGVPGRDTTGDPSRSDRGDR